MNETEIALWLFLLLTNSIWMILASYLIHQYHEVVKMKEKSH